MISLRNFGLQNFNQWYRDVDGINQSAEHEITLTKIMDVLVKQYQKIKGVIFRRFAV